MCARTSLPRCTDGAGPRKRRGSDTSWRTKAGSGWRAGCGTRACASSTRTSPRTATCARGATTISRSVGGCLRREGGVRPGVSSSGVDGGSQLPVRVWRVGSQGWQAIGSKPSQGARAGRRRGARGRLRQAGAVTVFRDGSAHRREEARGRLPRVRGGNPRAHMPTFKVQRERGFKYKEQRTPAWCDRVLWRTAEGSDPNRPCSPPRETSARAITNPSPRRWSSNSSRTPQPCTSKMTSKVRIRLDARDRRLSTRPPWTSRWTARKSKRRGTATDGENVGSGSIAPSDSGSRRSTKTVRSLPSLKALKSYRPKRSLLRKCFPSCFAVDQYDASQFAEWRLRFSTLRGANSWRPISADRRTRTWCSSGRRSGVRPPQTVDPRGGARRRSCLI